MTNKEAASKKDEAIRTLMSRAFSPEDVVQSRALSLIVDLVRERDHYREQMTLQSADNSRLEKQVEDQASATRNAIEQTREHMSRSDHYSLTAEYLSLVLLSLGYDTNGRKIPEKRREKLIHLYCENGEPIFSGAWPDDLKEAIGRIEKKLGYDPERDL